MHGILTGKTFSRTASVYRTLRHRQVFTPICCFCTLRFPLEWPLIFSDNWFYVTDDLLPLLKQAFGYSEFRDGQPEIIRVALQGQDSFVLMPTGGG
ncbi:MAG: superfamily II DNA helicase RecQ, partial [Rheinheimera aquimaris]